MAKKQSKSARIRKLLDQGKSVKQIVGMLGVTPQFVYTIRAQEKKKIAKEVAAVRNDLKKKAAKTDWVMMEVSTHHEPIGIPREEYEQYFTNNQPKPSLLARIKNFFLGA